MTEQDGGCPVTRAINSAAEKIRPLVVITLGSEDKTEVWDLSDAKNVLTDSNERLFGKQAMANLVFDAFCSRELQMVRLVGQGSVDAIYVKCEQAGGPILRSGLISEGENVTYEVASTLLNIHAEMIKNSEKLSRRDWLMVFPELTRIKVKKN